MSHRKLRLLEWGLIVSFLLTFVISISVAQNNLSIAGECSPNPDSQRVWRVSNSTDVIINFSWELANKRDSGTGTAGANSSTTFMSNTTNGANHIKLYVDDKLVDSANSLNEQCDNAPVPDNNESPGEEQPAEPDNSNNNGSNNGNNSNNPANNGNNGNNPDRPDHDDTPDHESPTDDGDLAPCGREDCSSIEVTAVCDGGMAVFFIRNTGEPGNGDMVSYSQLRIYVNDIEVLSWSFMLAGGASGMEMYPSNGQAVRLEADQQPWHPGRSRPRETIICEGDAGNVPVINLNGSDMLTLVVGETYVETATASDIEDGDLTGDLQISGTVNTSLAGTYILNYSVMDSDGNIATALRVVTVESVVTNTPPTITLVGSSPLFFTVGEPYVELGATAQDAEQGDLTGSITLSGTVNTSLAGTYPVTYSVTDDGGLSASVTRDVVVQDATTDTPPLITLTGAPTINLIVGDTYTELGATATDAEDGNLSGQIIVTGTVNTAIAGTYTVSYSVTDSDGNIASVDRTVIIEPNADGCNFFVAADSASALVSIATEIEANYAQAIICLGGGVYNLTNGAIGFTKIVEVVGNGSEIVGGTGSIFSITGGQFTIDNVTLSGGNSSFGGAIKIDGATVIVSNVMFTGNTASTSGGAVSVVGNGSFTATNSQFMTNSSNGFGGAIFASGNNTTVNLQAVTIDGNTANGSAAIEVNDANVTITDSIITGNMASIESSVMKVLAGGEVTITGTLIAGNDAPASSTIVVSMGAFTMTGSCMENNATPPGIVDLADATLAGGIIATGNWWNSPLGPSTNGTVTVRETVSATVDTSGYLTTEPAFCN